VDERVSRVPPVPDERIFSKFHNIHPKTGAYFSTYNGWFFEDPFVRESFHFFHFEHQSVVSVITSPLVEVGYLNYGKYRLFDGNCVYLLSVYGKRIF